jgi:hypothetical protein
MEVLDLVGGARTPQLTRILEVDGDRLIVEDSAIVSGSWSTNATSCPASRQSPDVL